MKMRLNKKGFTLVELVIVIAILAILAVVAVPVVSGITEKANKSADDTNLALYQSALERYNAEKGTYPTNAAGAVTAIATYTNTVAPISAPKTGSAGDAFIYTYTPATTTSPAKIKVTIAAPTVVDGVSNAISSTKP